MGILLTGYLYLLFIGAEIDSIPAVLWILRIITAVMAIHIGRLWNDKGFMLLACYLGYSFFRLFLTNPQGTMSQYASEYLLSGLWFCTGCYGLARILKKQELKRFLSLITAILITGITIYCLIGLYVAFTDQEIPSLCSGSWHLYSGRLALIYLPTTSGGLLGIFSLITLIAMLCTQAKNGKVLYFLAYLIILLTLALTDSRTAFCSLAGGNSIITGVVLSKTVIQKGKRFPVIQWTAAVLTILAVVAFSLFGLRYLVPVFNKVKMQKGLLFPSAMAEATTSAKTELTNQYYLVNGSLYLSGRKEIWQIAVGELKNNPRIILFGKSLLQPLIDNPWICQYAHCHNIMLQIVMENGLVGCLPLGLFLIMVLIRSICMIKDRKETLWLRFLPALIAAIWIGEMAECYTWFRSSQCPTGAFLFVIMGIVSFYSNEDSNTRIDISL